MDNSPRPRRSPQAQTVIYLIALGVYLSAIYLPFLWMPSLTRDGLLQWDLDRPWRLLIEGERIVFGDSPVLFRMQNYLLLFASSVVVFFITRRLVGPPLWLASFAAVQFMANPAKGPAIYAIAGVSHFLPLFLALLSLLCYIHWRLKGHWPYWLSALVLAFLASLHQPSYCLVTIPVFLLHLLYGEKRQWGHFAFAVAILWGGWWLVQGEIFHPRGITPHPMAVMLPLYPIGFLPDTVALFQAHLYLEWLCLLVWVLIAIQMCKKVRHPALNWAWGAALLIMIFSANPELVTLQRSETLLLPMALIHVGLAAVVQAVWQHPKWRKPAVLLTAFWCVVYFVLQVRAGLQWWPQN